MIQTENLTKKFGDFTAVDSLSLSIRQGEILGFLGPNGAGKTSTIMMLLGLSKPTSGEIRLFGKPLDPNDLSVRQRIGVVPEKHPSGMWQWMTAEEYLSFFAELFKVKDAAKRIERLLTHVELIQFRNRKISGFSRGMLQKLSFVRALLPDPEILILDEPQSGLDPLGIKQIRDLILEETREGRTIFTSSHLLSEMERISDRVAIIYQGKLLAEDSTANILSGFSASRDFRIDLDHVPEGIEFSLKALPFVTDAVRTEKGLTVSVDKKKDYRKILSEFIIGKGAIPLLIQEKTLSLEEAFITITRENLTLFTGSGGKHE
jgi:ABC-2 type transport system ATP-binding protein